MVGSSLEKDVDTPSTQELDKQFRSASYGREKEADKTENKELSNEQIQAVKQLLQEFNQAHPGTTCERDEVKYLAFLERDCTPDQRDAAIAGIREHLKIKKEHLEKYSTDVREHFMVDDQLTPEGTRLIEKYKDMTGEERKQAAKALEGIIEKRIQEKKGYEELLTESPHFSEDGNLTPHARDLLTAYEEAEGTQKISLKQRLLREIEKLELAEKRCENLYKTANDSYQQGNFAYGERALKLGIRMCDRYPDSPRLRVINEWNQRDLRNMADHTREQSGIQETKDELNSLVDIGDLQAAQQCSTELLAKTERFLNFTTNRDGQEVPRKDKYKTFYLRQLHRDAENERSHLTTIGEEEQVRQQEEEQALSEHFVDYVANSRQGLQYGVKMGVLEEEMKYSEESKRTDEDDVLKEEDDRVRNEDIEGITDTELNANQEGTNEVAVRFAATDQEDYDRLQRLSHLEDVNTGAFDQEGDAVTQDHRLQRLAGRETEKMTKNFVEEHRGQIDQDQLDQFEDNMHQKVANNSLGQMIQKQSRTAGPDLIRFGREFKESTGELGELVKDEAQGADTTPVAKDDNMANLAERLQQKRREQGQLRQAA